MIILAIAIGYLTAVAVLTVFFLALVPDICGLDTPVCLDEGCSCTGLAGDETHKE